MLVKLFDWKEQTYALLGYLNGEWERTGNVYQYGTKVGGWWQVTDLEVLEASTALRPWLSCGRWESNCSLNFWILCGDPFCQVSLGNGAHTPAAIFKSRDRGRCDCIEVKNPGIMEFLKEQDQNDPLYFCFMSPNSF